jgi:hypothetical protein
VINDDYTDIQDQDAGTPTGYAEDSLGYELQKKADQWMSLRLQVEYGWLADLRAYNQIPDNTPDIDPGAKKPVQPPTTYHGHIFSGMARSKANTAYARIAEPMFWGADKHWGIKPTPIPEGKQGEIPDIKLLQEEYALKASAMEKEMADQLLEMGYDGKLKSCIKEATVIGTGAIKGVVPGIKKAQRWKPDPFGSWDMQTEEIPYPSMGNIVSIFDLYPDPYALSQEDMTGCYERHVMNRGQFEQLQDDEQFDKQKIRDILTQQPDGNHAARYNEIDRRMIAKVLDTSGSTAGRFDVLEYWGQVSGKLLKAVGVDEWDGVLEETEVYFCCVWVCAGKTLLARIAPQKRQKIPYHFFRYETVPHQFWGIGPIGMVRLSSLAMQNAAIRALCDDLTLNVLPMKEININMLKDGTDPASIGPGHVWIKDKGDPDAPAIRFYSPDSKANAILPILDVSRRAMDEEANQPSYTQGMQIKGANETASGTSMLMGAADVVRKTTISNLEDAIKPLITSLYDWNMQWNPREDIKGDMEIDVSGITALVSKEVQSQRLTQFLAQTANPIDAQMVDRRYLLREAARSLEIDPDKAVPDLEEQMQNQQEYAQYGSRIPQPVVGADQPGRMGGGNGGVPPIPQEPDYTGNGNLQLQ